MDIEIRPLTEDERKYTYDQSQQITGQTGCIGYLRADMGADGKEFLSQWQDKHGYMKTQEFSEELNEIINSLRFGDANGGILKSRQDLAAYCHAYPDSSFGNGTDYGVRIDSGKYSYLLRLNPDKGAHNLYCYCYNREWLDRHIERAKEGIRFITSGYDEKFRIKDGEKVRVHYSDGQSKDIPCRYIDDYHLEFGNETVHICQLAEILERNGHTVEPTSAILPEKSYAMLPSTNEIILIHRGETGYHKTDNKMPSDIYEARKIVDSLNEELGVTRAQASAMLNGSMFGFDCPAADPRSYDKHGYPVPVRNNRYDALSERYEEVTIFGEPAMFTLTRIDRDTVPKDMYMYELRNKDGIWGRPCEIARGVVVDHGGTIITSKPVQLYPDGHRPIRELDLNYKGGCDNLADFRSKYPPVEKPPVTPKPHRHNDAR